MARPGAGPAPAPALLLGAAAALALACCAAAAPAAGPPGAAEAPGPSQTAWQRQLFGRVEQRAAKLSEAARPALLARLSSPAFRRSLAECCPRASALAGRPEALLERLRDSVLAAEVVSGFPGTAPADAGADAPGMTVADGLNGAFFLNAWQSVFLHSKDPASVFHAVKINARVATCHLGKVTIKTWDQAKCTGTPSKSISVTSGECMKDMQQGMVVQYSCGKEGLVWAKMWGLMENQRPPGSRERHDFFGALQSRRTSCPHEPPDDSWNATEGTCNSFVARNDTSDWEMQDDAETHSYGLRPFASRGAPSSLAEAAERGPYSLVNSFLLDAGSPIFGDVSAVFSTRAMQRVALVSPIDSGMYQISCVGGEPAGFQVNCSAFTPLADLGTMLHFNHLFLLNEEFWGGYDADRLALHFARLEAPWGSRAVRGTRLIEYWEAMPAGQLRYPDDVRFLIGSFPYLFGTGTGSRLRDWCRKQGWLLVWSLGLNDGHTPSFPASAQVLGSNASFPANQRIVDAEVALHSTAGRGLGVTAAALARFEESWDSAARLRRQARQPSNATWARRWQELIRALPGLRIMPLTDTKCFRDHHGAECVGVSSDGQCVCYDATASSTGAPTNLNPSSPQPTTPSTAAAGATTPRLSPDGTFDGGAAESIADSATFATLV